MEGRTKDFGDWRSKDIASFKFVSVDLLLSRLRYLINDVNLSLGLKDINCFRNSYEAVTFDMNETLELKQNISEFLGILYYLESQHNEMLASFGDKLEKLKLRLLSHSL